MKQKFPRTAIKHNSVFKQLFPASGLMNRARAGGFAKIFNPKGEQDEDRAITFLEKILSNEGVFDEFFKFEKTQSQFIELFRKLYEERIEAMEEHTQRMFEIKQQGHEKRILLNRLYRQKYKDWEQEYNKEQEAKAQKETNDFNKDVRDTKKNDGTASISDYFYIGQKLIGLTSSYADLYWNSSVFDNTEADFMSVLKSIFSFYSSPSKVATALNAYYQERRNYIGLGIDTYAAKNAWWGGSARNTLQENYKIWRRTMAFWGMNEQQMSYYADKAPSIKAMYKATPEEQTLTENIGGLTKNLLIPTLTTLGQMMLFKKLLFGKKRNKSQNESNGTKISGIASSAMLAPLAPLARMIADDKLEKNISTNIATYKVVITTNHRLLREYNKSVIV